jgi:multisubunit Na+/H+ antiporter MnhE subunit
MHMLVPMIVLTFTYLALSANLQFSNLVLGLMIAAGILILVRMPRRPVRWSRLPAAFMALGTFIGLLLFNVTRSGLQMVRIILHPNLPIKSGVVAIPAGCESEFGLAVSAHTISLPPGELFVELGEDGTMYIHSLDVETTAKQAGDAQKIQGRLLKKVLD